jgi:hypothetical protein
MSEHKRTRLLPLVRKAIVEAAAIRISKQKGGWINLTCHAVAKAASCSPALVVHYIGKTEYIKIYVLRQALSHEYLTIIAQALSVDHPNVRDISPILKHKALTTLMDR